MYNMLTYGVIRLSSPLQFRYIVCVLSSNKFDFTISKTIVKANL